MQSVFLTYLLNIIYILHLKTSFNEPYAEDKYLSRNYRIRSDGTSFCFPLQQYRLPKVILPMVYLKLTELSQLKLFSTECARLGNYVTRMLVLCVCTD